MARLLSALIALAILPACLYGPTTTTPLEPYREELGAQVVGADLDGSARMIDGRVRVELTMRAKCATRTLVHEQVLVEKRRNEAAVRAGMIGGFQLGLWSVVGGAIIYKTTENETAVAAAPWLIGGGALFMINGVRMQMSAQLRSKTVTTSMHEETAEVACTDELDREGLDLTPGAMTAITPWGDRVTARVIGRRASFVLDWSKSGIDLLAPSARELAAARWRFVPSSGSGEIHWTPKSEEIDEILAAIGRATGNDQEVVTGGAPPALEVVALEAKGPLHAGTPATLVVRIANRGRGVAYRVLATLRSGDPSLSGLRVPFGKIAPGATLTREVSVTIPREHADGKTRVLIAVTEGNGNVPDPFSSELEIVHALQPQLAMRADACTVTQGSRIVNESKKVDAGRQLKVRCTVVNTGDGPAVEAHIVAGFAAPGDKISPKRDLAPGAKAAFETIVQVPGNKQLDDELTLFVQARETDFGATSSWTLPLVIGMPRICELPISRAEYQRRLKEFQNQNLPPETLRAYEEQLLACLGD